ncbi:MAG: N-acetylglucosamine-6-phosphate deacetylase, partial [Acidimicrobiia bacterium]
MTDLVVSGGTVLTPAGRVEADVVVRAGRIEEICPRSPGGAAVRAYARAAVRAAARIGGGAPTERGGPADRLDVTGLVVAPGFVDLQCNGAAGVDLVAEPEGLWTLATALPRWGVTAWLPTVISAPAEVRARAREALRGGPPATVRGPFARPLGLHLEGPFLAPERAGAHPTGQLRPPDPALVAAEGWSAAEGVAMVTLAPELPRALDVVRGLVERGVVVAAGHSSASAEQASDAVDAGVRVVTHLFNAMAPLHHRDPGLAGVALADERVRSGVIADGVHLHPTTVALAARALGDRLCLVTDAVATLGSAAPGGGTAEPAGDVPPRPAVAVEDGRWSAAAGAGGGV